MATQTQDRGEVVGGNGGFKITHGGQIRRSFPVHASSTWLEGAAVEVNASGVIQASTAQLGFLTGITGTRRSPAGDVFNDHTVGSDKAYLLIDPAIVETQQLASGAIFAVNDLVYQNEAGKWTHAVPATDTRVYGVALNSAAAALEQTLVMDYLGAQRPTA